MPLSQVPQSLMDQLPPGADPVDAIKAGEGDGYWVLGRDGGVFAVGGATFQGAYTTLAPEQRQGTRTFTRILSRGGNGYNLVSQHGELYGFGTDEIETPPPPPAAAVTPPTNESAKVWLTDQLNKVGLGALATGGFKDGKSALDRFNELGGTEQAANAVLIEMRGTDIYKQKFPGMDLRQKNNLAPITEGQYMEWEEKAADIMRNAGLPPRFYDGKDDFADLIGVKDLSVPELQTRITEGYVAVTSMDPAVRQNFQRLFGVNDGDLAAFFLDPGRGEELIKQRVTESQIAGAASIQKFGELSLNEAEKLRGLGVGFSQAMEGFGTLSQQTELFEAGAGEGEDITREQQIGSVGGEAGSVAALKKRARQRTAKFEGGGTFAGGKEGIAGLGTS